MKYIGIELKLCLQLLVLLA